MWQFLCPFTLEFFKYLYPTSVFEGEYIHSLIVVVITQFFVFMGVMTRNLTNTINYLKLTHNLLFSAIWSNTENTHGVLIEPPKIIKI